MTTWKDPGPAYAQGQAAARFMYATALRDWQQSPHFFWQDVVRLSRVLPRRGAATQDARFEAGFLAVLLDDVACPFTGFGIGIADNRIHTQLYLKPVVARAANDNTGSRGFCERA